MSLITLKNRFNALLTGINGSATTNFATTVETAYEALALVRVMQEYNRIYGPLTNLIHPASNKFLNQKPGKFRIERSFRMDFQNGESFYFSADIEIFGLEAMRFNRPIGILFEADVVVIPTPVVDEVVNVFHGYPAPQHIDSVYECKYGKYNKSQLRELLGLKRHLCYLSSFPTITPTLFRNPVINSSPPIPLKMIRPRALSFFDRATERFYDLEQVIVS